MIGIGPVELVVILVVALIVVGPEKMPELARHVAKIMRELRSAMDDVKEQFDELTREDLLPTKEINTYYQETIDTVKKAIEPPPDMPDLKEINKEIEKSLQQPANDSTAQSKTSGDSLAEQPGQAPEKPLN